MSWSKHVCLLLLVLAMAPGCNCTGTAGGGEAGPGEPCEATSDCQVGLVCNPGSLTCQPDGAGDGGTMGVDGGVGEFDGCNKVDLVIALDASGSMSEELDAMHMSVFPDMATRLLVIGGGLDDYRVGVLDACPDPADYHTLRADGSSCNFESGQVWMESDSTDLPGEFACAADLYLDDITCSGNNDDEQPASAALISMQPPWSTGPNAGFRRADALLVVIAITDEDEQPTGAAQTPQEIYDALVALNANNDVSRMVFLGIGGASSCSGAYGSADQADTLMALTQLFIDAGRGVYWDLCQGMLEDGLEEAMTVIEQACEEFEPIL